MRFTRVTLMSAGVGEPPPLTENGQVANDQRQFQVGLKYKF